jgi:hypothetical protein
LNACANFSLVEVSFDGRSEQFVLTFKALMYLRILRSEFKPVAECIKDILLDAKMREPRRDVDPEEHFWKVIRTGLSGDIPSYFKLHALSDAFSTAANRYVRGTIENRILIEVSALLKEGSSIFSSSKPQRNVGRRFLNRAVESLKAISASNSLAKQQQIDDLSIRLKRIGTSKRGDPIYRVT